MIMALAAAALLLSACKAPFSNPNEPEDDNLDHLGIVWEADTAIGNNGFVTDDEVPRFFDIRSGAICAVYSPAKKMTEIKMEGITYPTINEPCSTSVYIVIPGSKRGEFMWDDMLTVEDISSYAVITIKGIKYYSMSGSTRVALYRDQNGAMVGTFSGTLQTLHGDKLTVAEGRFEAPF
jgi:hypothetical protein